MLYSKNGSIPKPRTDHTPGWVEVPYPPTPPEGMEVVWWDPPGWVIRPPMPVEPGYYFKWSQSEEQWMRFPDEYPPNPDPGPGPDITLSPSTTATDTLASDSGADTIGP